METAAPIDVPPLPVETAEPSDAAVPSVFADERTETAPPAWKVRPFSSHACDFWKTMLTEIAAATDTPPSEVDAEPPPLVPPPVLPVDDAVLFACERSPA